MEQQANELDVDFSRPIHYGRYMDSETRTYFEVVMGLLTGQGRSLPGRSAFCQLE